ncbi:MAG TPA: ribonucleoside triphosphate reductase [Candidatus Woesebacteria bacterium]|nr:ribonucleoside triphosphate reductase [Candidatus Woesebacteria bacterium]
MKNSFKNKSKLNETANKISRPVRQICKRDGRIVDFDRKKIFIAISKAMWAVGEVDLPKARQMALEVSKILDRRFDGHLIPGVEQIQDIVEEVLIKNRLVAVSKAYILYRELHNKIRSIESLVDSDELIKNYLGKLDWRVKENSNMTFSLQGLNNHVASLVSSNFWLNQIYPKKIGDAHLNGDLHLHDLAILAAYCCGWDLREFLVKGFGGVSGKLNSRPPKHFRTALGQLVNLIYTLQGETAGAQAVSNFDTLLAPFIYYDKLDYLEVKQALQEFMFNMNVPTRVGFQTPFSNVTLDLKVPKMMAKESVIVGGQPQKKTYGDFQKEMNLFNRAFGEVLLEGDAQGRVFSFPIPTINITKDFDWDNPDLENLWEATRKYGIPYFSNFINSDMSPEDARSMCCRLRLDNRELRKKGGGLFGANPLTGAVGVVTINLPRLGFLAKKEKDFFQNLAAMMDLAKESLMIKRKVVEDFTGKGLYPYSQVFLTPIKERFGEYWKNHFNTIGLVGMNEACLNLLGENIATKKGRSFALKVLKFMRERIGRYQEETGQLFNLEATPAEGTSYRFAREDRKRYPEIIFANNRAVKEKKAEPYYTNSTHLPVDYTADIFEALEHQDELQCQYTGGTVLHGFLGESLSDIQTVKTAVKKIAENFHLPYFTLTPTFSICPRHGYLKGGFSFCPKCDEDLIRQKKELEKEGYRVEIE